MVPDSQLIEHAFCSGGHLFPGAVVGFIFIVPHDAFQHRVPLGKLRYLGQIADIEVPCADHASVIRLLQPCHDFQQGGFACAVDADQAHLFPFIDGKGRVVKQQPFCV